MPPDFAMFDRISLAIANGASMRSACADHKVPIATYSDWKRKHAERGHIADQRRHKSGRKPAWELTETEALCLRKWHLAKGSVDKAMTYFLRDPECRPETREWATARLDAYAQQRKPVAWPESIHRAGHLTDAEKAHFQGPKAVQNIAPSTRTTNTMKIGGREYDLRLHTAWVFDDYSSNQPYYLEYTPGQFRACRQVLAGVDLGTHGWLGFDLIGKERDAYTGGDSLRVVLRCIEAHATKPDVLVLEQGRWKSKAFLGLLMENGARWGHIAEAGIRVHYAHTPREKREIESYFNVIQSHMAECGADIGRSRDDKEREQLDLVAVNAGRKDPRKCGFLSFDEAAAVHGDTMAELNRSPRRRQALTEYVSADELAERWKDSPKRPLLPEERWLFFPIKTEATVRRGAIEIIRKDIDPRGWVFRVNGVRDDVYLPDGYRVYVAFDPEWLDLGCVVANRETGVANRYGYRLGQNLMLAPLESAVPRLQFADDSGENAERSESWKHRQNALKTARTQYNAILPHGKKGLRIDAMKNRLGAVRQPVYSGDISRAVLPSIPAPEVPAEEPATTARIALPESRPTAPEPTPARATAARLALPAQRGSEPEGATRLPRITAARIALPAVRPTAEPAEAPRLPRATAARLAVPREHVPADDHDTASIF